ncbi:MAG: thiamine pyrophosphate-dependent enzyme [Deltaproteobacteria bacterium]|nr:thiamine pyrophosphate-dependent enzyme [Deltaproteobacteria bacterium]
MIDRDLAYAVFAEHITDQIVVTGVGSQTSAWMEVSPRPLNLYLRGPMGLAPAVGLGVALARPDRKVVVLEGDGGMLMGLTSLASIAQCRPPNLLVICMDNGVYEAGGRGPTVNAGRTDFLQIARGLGIPKAIGVTEAGPLRTDLKELLAGDTCAFLHVSIGLRKTPWAPAIFRPTETKFRFQAALQENPGTPTLSD